MPMADERSSIDFNDPRLQYAAAQTQFEPVNPRPRASSHVRADGYRPDPSRYGHSQQPLGEAASSAFPHAEPHAQVHPELIAQITANVISQLKTTKLDSVSASVPANVRYPPPPPPPQTAPAPAPAPAPPGQRAAPLSPSTDSVASPSPYPPNLHTPPLPYTQSELPRTGSPRSQPPILQPNPMYPREFVGAQFQDDRRTHSPLSENSESGYTRPRGPTRLSTGREETTLEKIWGQLFDEECNPTARLGQLLRGLAIHIIEDYEPRNSIVITPAKMLKYYEDVKLPNEMYPWSTVFDDDRCSISRIYRELGCQHHLIQEQDDQRPEIPSLTPVGFQRWVTLLIQAHPDEEYERLQKAVLDMPISNPDEKKERFPKECSRRLFPGSADLRIRERLEKAISKHARVGLPINRGDSHPHRPSVGTDSEHASRTPQPSLSTESTYIPPNHRRRPSVESAPPSAFGTSIERERAPYSNVPAEAIIDDTNPTSTPAQPLERARKPYSAVPGGGKAYDDEGPAKSSRADSGSSKIGRSNSMAKVRPLSMGIMGPRSMDGGQSEHPPYNPPPTNARRRRSPSFSQAGNDLRRSENDFRRFENDTRGYPPSFQAPSGSTTDGHEEEARRYGRDRARRSGNDDGREYGDNIRPRHERGSYVNDEDVSRADGRARGSGYDYTPAAYGGSAYR